MARAHRNRSCAVKPRKTRLRFSLLYGTFCSAHCLPDANSIAVVRYQCSSMSADSVMNSGLATVPGYLHQITSANRVIAVVRFRKRASNGKDRF